MQNNAMYNVVDMVELMDDTSVDSVGNEEVGISVDDALFEVLDRRNCVDLMYISMKTGLKISKVTEELRGAVFQQPEVFADDDIYDETRGWVLSSRYLSGNIRRKLESAIEANKKFPGRFTSNIEALKKILPQRVDIDEIHLSLGATWIPVQEISLFLTEFLNLKNPPEVVFYDDLKYYRIIGTEETKKSVMNTITYGVSGNITSAGYSYNKQYLTAINIVEQTLNAKTIKVYDYVLKKSGRITGSDYEPVFNREKTIEAQNKQRAIIDAFKDYVYASKARISRFERYYNDAMVGYAYSPYSGDFMKLRDLNPEIKLYKHQRDAIARVLLSDANVLFSHDVGTGKTYEIIVSVHELYRLGQSRKNMIVVPNNVLKSTADNHRMLYENDNILVVYPKDFSPKYRRETLEKIRDGEYVAIYIAYSSFDRIVMSKEYYVNKYKQEIQNLTTAIFNASSGHEKEALKRQKTLVSKKLEKYTFEEVECPWLTFDKLGITTLVVDEAHNYKNIPIRTHADNIVGLSAGSSKKCREMLEKTRYADRLIFATGTPLTNSLADLYAFQTYLQSEVLEYHNIDTFDTWINTFGQRETMIECDVDANSGSLRTTTRFSSFHNLGELMSIFSQVCDFYHMPEDAEGLPAFNGYTDVCVPKNAIQHDYILSLSERTEKIRGKEVRRTDDNLLKVTIDGRMIALDVRLKSAEILAKDARLKAPETMAVLKRESKINACAGKVVDLYCKYPDSVQIVFSDIGTPKETFNVYHELAQVLTERGIASHEIAFVHDATTESARSKLFEAMNNGTVKVVVGSTQKLGVGVNVQEKLVAIHHLSVPWRPADMVQREGRIMRKGNTSEEIYIFRYITEGSFDAYSWQLLENKQRFISSFLSGTSVARDMDDIADTVLNYAEVKALAIGNPLIKKRVEVSNRLERVKIACRSRQKEMQQLRGVIESLPEQIGRLNKLSAISEKDYTDYIGAKESIPNDERIAFGEELLDALSDNVNVSDERVFDTYQGFYVCLPAGMDSDHKYVVLRSGNGGVYNCDMEGEKTPLGCSKSIDAVLDRLDKRAAKLAENTQIARKQLNEAQADLDTGNPYIKQIEIIKEELTAVDSELENIAVAEGA